MDLHQQNELKTSRMADTLIPSEIIRLGNEIQKLIQKGQKVYNLTIGDFDSSVFPIPDLLLENILKAYRDGHTNYPPAHGVLPLREAVSGFIYGKLGLEYGPDDILISGGSRPLIYAVYRTIVDPGEGVIYPVPSWNNNHYCHLSGAEPMEVIVHPDDNFMPSAQSLTPYLEKAVLVSLCSPQNPTGTCFEKNKLLEICEKVMQENKRRKGIKKPLYILYDQIYWQLCFGETEHFDPVGLMPELRDYVIYIDGISKSFASTGVRVGWAMGPGHIMARMRAILSHIGAWAPKAEQMATAWFLQDSIGVEQYMDSFRSALSGRLSELYRGIMRLKDEGYPIDVIKPQGAIYLTVRFPWKKVNSNQSITFENQASITKYLLETCQWAMVPFYAFGSDPESDWYRISVGTVKMEEIPEMLEKLKLGMQKWLNID
jgi:aspartate aminotransferase